ncbi:MAG: LytTR family DNA-binding domain-containing protein [Pseudomonadota bacterium]
MAYRIPNWFDPRSSWPGFLLWAGLAASIALTALAPSASNGLSALMGLVYWLTHVFLALAILAAAQAILQRMVWLDRASPWLIVVLAGLLGALLFTPAAYGLDSVFPTIDDEDDLIGKPLLADLVGEFTDIILPFLLIWTGFNATRLLRIESGSLLLHATQEVTEREHFWSLIPQKLGRDLIAMSSELHYLRVYTTEGNALILHAFGRAIDHLDDASGMRIHRSHWVATHHVQALRRDGEKVICRLDNGVELPVSRPYRSKLRSRLK